MLMLARTALIRARRSVSAGVITTFNGSDKAARIFLTGGNLTATHTDGAIDSGVANTVRATVGKSSGLVYLEFLFVTSQSFAAAGMMPSTDSLTAIPGKGAAGAGYSSAGLISVADSTFGAGDSIANGSVLGVAANLNDKLIYFAIDDVYQDSMDPEGATGGATLPSGLLYPAWGSSFTSVPASDSVTANFGATAFAHSPPTGYVAWNSSP